MPRVAEVKHLPYRPDQMFALVADVERYPEFLPWCVGARIRSRSSSRVVADLMIGFKAFRERFTSAVTLNPPGEIDVVFTEGPFHHLDNHWHFRSGGEGCQIDFLLDFEFRNRVYAALIGGLFEEATHRMMAAFITRADALYGPPGR